MRLPARHQFLSPPRCLVANCPSFGQRLACKIPYLERHALILRKHLFMPHQEIPIQGREGTRDVTSSVRWIESEIRRYFAGPTTGRIQSGGLDEVYSDKQLHIEGIREKTAPARRNLIEWVEAKSDTYRTAMKMIAMGCNSPFVPASSEYFDVQIPIRLDDASERDDP